MNKIYIIIFIILFFSLSKSNAIEDVKEFTDAINKAMQVLDSFMYSFNARDIESLSETLNYPHVRIAGGKVTVWDTKEEYSATNVFNRLTATGWDHSAWLSIDVVLVSKNKVHISTVFQRYDKNNNPHKLPTDMLPVELPKIDKLEETGNPLDKLNEWKNIKINGKDFIRETDTLDTFVDSSLYFLRFCSPNNSSYGFSHEDISYWMPVDQYIGGVEHAILHLLYSRFFMQAL